VIRAICAIRGFGMTSMDGEKRPGINRKVLVAVSLVGGLCLILGTLTGLRATREVRRIVADQFNEEQLVICRNLSRAMEKDLKRLEREMLLAARRMARAPRDDELRREAVFPFLCRASPSGVVGMDVLDLREGKRQIHALRSTADLGPSPSLPDSRQWETREEACGSECDDLPLQELRVDQVWASSAEVREDRLLLRLVLPVASDSFLLLCARLDLRKFLSPFLEGVRSGKTGYAWIIDHRGTFLYHPRAEFTGKSAFRIRGEEDPGVSYERINFIQENRMLKGEEGTGWYYSRWHREDLGRVEKLIAYAPVRVALHPSRNWSVAMVAPAWEIERAFRSGEGILLFSQGLVVVVILAGAGAVLFFEVRWSRTLEERVSQRTEELKKSEERYRSLVESAEDFIFTVDASGMFQSMNSFTANFFGGRPEAFTGKPMEALFGREVAERELKLIRLVFRWGKSVRDEFSLETGEHRISISANFMPLKNDAGVVLSVLCIARDVTENKRLEKQLVNTEKLASMGTLAAGVAHEINNPLGVILGFCDLLKEKADPRSREYGDLETIERQGLLCKRVVENLLSFARQAEGEATRCSLNECIEQIVRVVRHTLEMNDVELRLRLEAGIPPVRGDARQLQQVFLNLVNNAMGAMKEGGVLTVSTSWDAESRKATAEVSDTGEGIREEDMDRIFEPFFTTKPEGEGTGLGLFVSYGIVSKYGGTLVCTSRRESSGDRPRGTAFLVKLPGVEEES